LNINILFFSISIVVAPIQLPINLSLRQTIVRLTNPNQREVNEYARKAAGTVNQKTLTIKPMKFEDKSYHCFMQAENSH
jgi:hypothetical protein